MTSAFSGHPLLCVPLSSAADVCSTVDRARCAQEAWGPAPAAERTRWLMRLRGDLRAHRAWLGSVVEHAGGLGPRDRAAELRQTDKVLLHAFKALRASVGLRQALRGAQARPAPGRYSPHRPAVISSRVHEGRPLASLLEGALPALVGGSAVVTEVDVRSAVPALAVQALARRAGLPRHVWQLMVSQDSERATVGDLRAVLNEHADDFAPQCCLRGTSGSGKAGTRVPGLLVLRHDGCSRAAAQAAVDACFSRAGRMCSTTPLIAVHADRQAEFVRQLVGRAARFTPESTLPGRGQLTLMRKWSATVAASGALPLLPKSPTSGTTPPVPEPVALFDHSAWYRRLPELPPAGPVALVTTFTRWSEALALARHTGTHLSVFTRTRAAQLDPQFAGLPASRIGFNRASSPTPAWGGPGAHS
ncbi:aldehyde dehydrogenase family protein [Streptomyces sp. WAC 01529]|uniref:aldehyde dehydrogenase family protein n=1 Tax=Streptomyces sp. WAC 01529 TaxID=2203205 RepID=UPI0013DE9888|nr:aldehyde dehydrogenase family protein [Streptomyces sp. WAC 01529]